MRQTLSHFGWIIIIVIILSILIGAATPAGQNLMEKMFDFSDKLTQEGIDNGLVNPDTLYSITVANAPDGLLVPSKETATPGDVITITLTNTEDYYCEGITMSYKDRTNTVESLSFTMPDGNVTISPIWGEFPYSKIYFSSSNDARSAANNISDDKFFSRPTVTIDGVECYVVYDYSEYLGYNNNLLDSCYAGSSAVVKVITGTSCKTISASAFENCANLKEVFISKSVKKIEKAAFYNCSNLNSLIFDDGLEEIGDSAFYNCALLGYDGDSTDDVVNGDAILLLPETLKIIGGSAFAHTSYETTYIPFSVHTIGNYAFYSTEITDTSIFKVDNIANTFENSFTI